MLWRRDRIHLARAVLAAAPAVREEEEEEGDRVDLRGVVEVLAPGPVVRQQADHRPQGEGPGQVVAELVGQNLLAALLQVVIG